VTAEIISASADHSHSKNLAQAGATPCLSYSYFFSLTFRSLKLKCIPNVITESKTHYKFNTICHIAVRSSYRVCSAYNLNTLPLTSNRIKTTILLSATARRYDKNNTASALARKLQVPGWLCLIDRPQPFLYFYIAIPELSAELGSQLQQRWTGLGFSIPNMIRHYISKSISKSEYMLI